MILFEIGRKNCQFPRYIRFWIVLFIGIINLTFSGIAHGGAIADPFVPVNPSESLIGTQIPDISFVDIEGKEGRLSDYKPYKALVIVLSSMDCPICGKLSPEVVQLQQNYEKQSVAFLMVNVNRFDSTEKLLSGRRKFGLTARYVPDFKQELSAALMPKTTTETFVLDSRRTLLFRGPINDQFGIGFTKSNPKRRFLEDAIEAHLSGWEIPIPSRAAPGCNVDIAVRPQTLSVNYHNGISRIVQRHCQGCHFDGGPSFSLATLPELKAHAQTIKSRVASGQMPPWFASPKFGSFLNDTSLSNWEREALLHWIDSGMPEGDASEAPLPLPQRRRELTSPPDIIYTQPIPFKVKRSGLIEYQFFRTPTQLTEDKWVQSMELLLDHPEVTHHVVIFLIDKVSKTGTGPLRKLIDGRKPFGVFFVGQRTMVFPEGVAAKLPMDKDILFQTHYVANGTEIFDQPKLALRYAPHPPNFVAFSTLAFTNVFVIPPGHPNYKVTATHDFTKHSKILGLMPHMHLRGKRFLYELRYPDKHKETILEVPKFNFQWQIRYQPISPIDIPAGTQMRVTAWYDNSDGNPNNPDPSKEVKYGEQLDQEMMFGFFDGYTVD